MARYEKRRSSHLVYSSLVSILYPLESAPLAPRYSFTRHPHLLLSSSHPAYPLLVSALSLFASRLPATRICSSSSSHPVYPPPASAPLALRI
ncbi:hypothetical protein, partial [Vibrio crassostreae]|uniref:hypothetical protein n=1 Tax=Vibrio crassostreae TaxID=246167 RepID=UPI001B3064A4